MKIGLGRVGMVRILALKSLLGRRVIMIASSL